MANGQSRSRFVRFISATTFGRAYIPASCLSHGELPRVQRDRGYQGDALTSITDPDGNALGYAYDTLGRGRLIDATHRLHGLDER